MRCYFCCLVPDSENGERRGGGGSGRRLAQGRTLLTALFLIFTLYNILYNIVPCIETSYWPTLDFDCCLNKDKVRFSHTFYINLVSFTIGIKFN